MGHGGSPVERSNGGEQGSRAGVRMAGKVPWAYTHPRKAVAFPEVARVHLATRAHGAQRHSLGGGRLQRRERPEEWARWGSVWRWRSWSGGGKMDELGAAVMNKEATAALE